MQIERAIDLGWFDLVLAAALVLVAIAISVWQRLGLGKSLLVGAIRATVQLLLIGHVLLMIFASREWSLVLAFLLLMVLAATIAATRRLEKHSAAPLRLICGIAILVGSSITLLYVGTIVVHVSPWYDPRYLIPIFGMIVGNAMNGATLTADRLYSEMRARHADIEALLALGASPAHASRDAVKKAISAAMIPTVNALAVVGIVALPGMMTGQILAGGDPTQAVRYQAMVMFMLTAATAITSTCVALWYRRTFFSPAEQLLPLD